MLVKLNVTYQEKDIAKSLGAKWNPNVKSWFTDDISKVQGLTKWLNPYNVLCENIYIFVMERTCWRCKKQTEVVCLGSNKSYSVEDDYKLNNNIQLLSYVTDMPALFADFMKNQYRYFPSYSKIIDETYYLNHCKYCKSIQGDNYLHEVPEEAFYKKLCYSDSKPATYFNVKNQFCIPIQAQLPYYDETSGSMELFMLHMETEIENRASLNISQRLINKLFDVSIKGQDIEIPAV